MLRTRFKPLLTASPGRRTPWRTSEQRLSTRICVNESQRKLRVCKDKLALKPQPSRRACRHQTSNAAPAPALGFLGSLFKPKKKYPAIVQEGDPKSILRQEAKDVDEELFGTEKLKELSEDMIAIMRKAPGVGLAAPQIGVGLKIIVLEDKEEYMKLQSERMQKKLDRRPFGPVVICNPQLKPIGKQGFRYWEGCLSVAGYQGLVERYLAVDVIGSDIYGDPITFQASGWQARILQHEADHVQGVLYIDRALPDTVLKGRPPEGFNVPMGACKCSHPLQ